MSAGRSRRLPKLKIETDERIQEPVTPNNLDKKTTMTFGERTIVVEPDDIDVIRQLGRGAYGQSWAVGPEATYFLTLLSRGRHRGTCEAQT